MQKIALFAGSLNPPTYGHLDLIQRAASLVDQLLVGVAFNAAKSSQPFLSPEERVHLLSALTSHLPNIQVLICEGLTVDFAIKRKANFLIRGLRPFDAMNEMQRALANKRLANLETIFLPCDEKWMHVSSTIVREIVSVKGPLAEFVPLAVETLIRNKYYLAK